MTMRSGAACLDDGLCIFHATPAPIKPTTATTIKMRWR